MVSCSIAGVAFAFVLGVFLFHAPSGSENSTRRDGRALKPMAFPQESTSRDTSEKPNVSNMSSSEQMDKSLRLVILSDTHRGYGGHVPPGDVLIHCGDSEWAAEEFEQWASEYDHRYKIVICGNMDSRLSRDQTFAGAKNIFYLQDSFIDISGVKIYGSPWTPEFVGVFQLRSQQQATDVWSKVPADTDVLITHGPPKSILDVTSRGQSVGDKALLDILSTRNVRPRVHCFGHVHESYGTLKRDGTLFCNSAVYNGHRPIVVDVPFDRNQSAIIVDTYDG